MWALNRATLLGSGGLAFTTAGYDVTGALAVLASRLSQALRELQCLTARRGRCRAGGHRRRGACRRPGGMNKTRLRPDSLRGPVVTRIFL